jgi:hypothetical protein
MLNSSLSWFRYCSSTTVFRKDKFFTQNGIMTFPATNIIVLSHRKLGTWVILMTAQLLMKRVQYISWILVMAVLWTPKKILTWIPHIAENNFLAFIIAECALHVICGYIYSSYYCGMIVELHPFSRLKDFVSVFQ